MNEEDRKLQILNAEAAIRELAGRMAEASASTKQADKAAEMLDAAASSLKELNGQFIALIEDKKRAVDEERKSLDRAHESLEICARDLKESLGGLETHLTDRINELLDARFKDLPQDVKTISNNLSFLIDQNEALGKRIQALHLSVEELSHEFQRSRNNMAESSLEIEELRSQVIYYQERLSSLEQVRATGLSHRLRTAIIGGGLGMIFIFVAIRLG